MRKRFRVLGVALLAVFAFSAIASAAAHAEPRWKVAGGFLGAAAEKTFEGTSKVSVFKIGGLEIKCTSDKVHGWIKGSLANTMGRNREVAALYEGCVVVGAEKVCTVNSPGEEDGIIETADLSSTVVWLIKVPPAKEIEEEVGDVLEPEVGGVFTTLEFGGEECPIGGAAENITGEVIGKFKQKAGAEFLAGELEFPAAPILTYYTTEANPRTAVNINRLKLGGANATYISTESVSLNPAEKVGVYRG